MVSKSALGVAARSESCTPSSCVDFAKSRKRDDSSLEMPPIDLSVRRFGGSITLSGRRRRDKTDIRSSILLVSCEPERATQKN